MKKILHLSDFHIKLGMPQPQDNEVIVSLINKLHVSETKIDIIVYTGDFIDSKAIGEIIKSVPDEHKAEAWDSEATKAFELAKAYFLYIKEELEVNNDNIIVCCGNHDTNRNISCTDRIDCSMREICTCNKRFQQFDKFCKDLNLKNCSSNAYFKPIDDFNFFVVNTNVIDDKRSGLCVDCNSVEKLFEDNKKLLRKNLQENKKNHNVFVAHSPQADFCEFFKFGYLENNYKSKFEEISKYFDCFFVGDKHSVNVTGSEFIMGAPLSESQITYGIYEFNDNLQMVYKKIRYNAGSWTIHESDDVMNEILKESINELKQSGINLLYGFKNVDMEDAIKNYLQNKSNFRWNYMDEMFKSYITLQKPRIGRSGEEIKIDGNIVDYIIRLVNESSGRYPIILRGMPKIGKSLFLTVVYIGMMYGYLNNIFNYIPIYFDMDSHIKNNEGNDEILKEIVERSLKRGKELSKKYNKPICYIFDGMRQHIYGKDCIEEYLHRNIGQYISFDDSEFENKIIYSIDTDVGLNEYETQIHKSKKAEYLLYFNPIMVNKQHSNEKFIQFINSFAKLYGYDNPDTLIKNIKKLGLQYVNLNTLLNFKEYLKTDYGKCCKTELYKELAEKLIDENIVENVYQVCFELYYQKIWHNEIIEKNKDIPSNVFYILRKQVYLRNYLIANYYVESMKKATDSVEIQKIDVLDECFGYEISSLICDIIYKERYKTVLKRFENRYYDVLSFKGKSMITYLCGRLRFSNTDLNRMLLKEREEVYKTDDIREEEVEFFKLVAQRSIIISSITGLNDYKQIKNEYIKSLISNKKIREVNRQFYLLYYGDRRIENVPFHNEVKEGFDFYNVYHVLASRLNEWDGLNETKRLVEIELFTLCDLIQQRIDSPIAYSWSEENEMVKSIFYDEKHNKPKTNRAFNILTFMTEMIKKYLEATESDQENDIFKIYLHEKDNEFNAALCKIKDRALDDAEQFNPTQKLDVCAKISTMEKIGWKIKDEFSTMDKQLYESYKKNKSYETVLEHIYECYLIGLLYLPLNGEGDYDKQKILNILLIHDLGECYSEDYPPFYNKIKDVKKEEDIFNKGLYVNGVHEGIADLTDCLDLWMGWGNETPDVNIRIAKDIDKIHMIYKMLTLLKNTDIDLSEERIRTFYDERKKLSSNEGKAIFNSIVKNNINFKEIINRII